MKQRVIGFRLLGSPLALNYNSVHERVTRLAKSNQIVLCVVPRLTAEYLMMNLKMLYRSAILATPIVACEYLLAQSLKLLGPQTNSRLF